MFRTTVRLDPSRAPGDVYALHQAVAAATGNAAYPRVLWAQPAPDLLVIHSPAEPRVERIPGCIHAHIRPAPDPSTWPSGTTVKFGLIGNPIRSVGRLRPDGTPSRNPGRYPLPVEARPAWLRRKLGMVLQIAELQHQQLPPARSGPPKQITITRHLFTGHGTVTDPRLLAGLTWAGVGAGKGLGCGLLLVDAR